MSEGAKIEWPQALSFDQKFENESEGDGISVLSDLKSCLASSSLTPVLVSLTFFMPTFSYSSLSSASGYP